MSANQTKYPQLRFKGFTDPWEKRTLGQTTTKAKSYSLSRDVERDHETGYRYIHYGDIHTGVADIVTEHTKLPNIEPANYDELRVNDLVVADASEDYQGIAEPAVVVGLPTHLVAGLHTITLRPSSASSLYLYYLLHTDSFKHFGYQMGTGLKVFGISWSNLSEFTFMIPSRPEQEMIVKLIESVDNLIAVNQRKLAKLKELKQGYLQKMFPQNGSKFPQLRFAGFAYAWEKRKLGELANIRRGASPRPIKSKKWFSQTSQVGWIRISDVTEQNGRIHQVEQHLSDAGQKKTLVLKSKHLLLSIAATVGKPVQNYIQVGVHDGFIVFMDPKFDLDFMFYFLEKYRPNWARFGQPGSQININSELVRDLVVSIPTVHEQDAVAQFIITLDNLIAATQCKLDLLKKLKKGYLQKMFC